MNYLLISRYFHHSTSGIQTYIDAIDKAFINDSLTIVTLKVNKIPKSPVPTHKIFYCNNLNLDKKRFYRDIFNLLIKGHIGFFLLLILNRTVRQQIAERYRVAFAEIEKHKIQMCISAHVIPEGVISVMLKKKYGINSVILLHGSEIHSFSGKIQYKWLMQYILKNTDLVVANSVFMKKEVQRFCSHNLQNLFVNYLGYDEKIFNKTKPLIPAFEKDDKIKILSVSNFVFGKGLDILIKALAIVKKVRSDFIYIMLGNRQNSEYQNFLDKLIKDNQLNNYIIHQEAVKHERLPEFYHSSDFVVLPSRQEAFGLVALEANACGIPVIGADIGGIPEIVKDGENGLLFKSESPEDLAEKILFFLENPEYCNQLGLRALDRINSGSYSWNDSMNRLKQQLHKFL